MTTTYLDLSAASQGTLSGPGSSVVIETTPSAPRLYDGYGVELPGPPGPAGMIAYEYRFNPALPFLNFPFHHSLALQPARLDYRSGAINEATSPGEQLEAEVVHGPVVRSKPIEVRCRSCGAVLVYESERDDLGGETLRVPSKCKCETEKLAEQALKVIMETVALARDVGVELHVPGGAEPAPQAERLEPIAGGGEGNGRPAGRLHSLTPDRPNDA